MEIIMVYKPTNITGGPHPVLNTSIKPMAEKNAKDLSEQSG